MKKARVLSTISISLGLALPAWAQVPAPGCYARTYDAAHLAAHPAQGVAALRLWVFDDTPGSPAVLVSARMADQGQGAADGVGGQVLTQYAYCDPAEGSCFVECDGGSFATRAAPDGGLTLTTSHFSLGEGEGCGGFSNLSEGGETVYRLLSAPVETCADLSQVHPLPPEGCWGVDYSDMVRGQGVLSLRLRMQPADGTHAFPVAQGTLAVKLPDGGRAAQVGMGGVRASLPVWCSARDGRCLSGIDDGTFLGTLEDNSLVLRTRRFAIWGQEGAVFDVASDGAEALHRLRGLPMSECRGME